LRRRTKRVAPVQAAVRIAGPRWVEAKLQVELPNAFNVNPDPHKVSFAKNLEASLFL